MHLRGLAPQGFALLSRLSRKQPFFGCLVGSLLCGSFAFRLLADFRAVRVPELVCIPAKKDRLKTYPFFAGAPSGTRTPDPLIKSQLLYQLS